MMYRRGRTQWGKGRKEASSQNRRGTTGKRDNTFGRGDALYEEMGTVFMGLMKKD